MVFDIEGWELKTGDKCPLGSQLRPHVVWFGEEVSQISPAIDLAQEADIFIVVGTSLAVYPAAGLIEYVAEHVPKYLIDPTSGASLKMANLQIRKEKAAAGLPRLVDELIAQIINK
jgi:NAD-dependent deacetylase